MFQRVLMGEMRMKRAKFAFALLLPGFATVAPCDTLVIAQVEVHGGTESRVAALPVAGTYRFLFGKDAAMVSSPSGKIFIFDFERKTFTSLNPTLRTYYQTNIADVLGIGDRVLPGNRVDGSSTFSPSAQGSPSSSLLASAKSYQVDLKSKLVETGSGGGGLGAGYSPRGGFVFNGGNSGERSMTVGSRHLEGVFWMGDPIAGLDRDQMNSAIESVLLWGAPQGKELSKKVRDSNSVILGGDYSMTVETQRNAVGIAPPTVSIRLTSSKPGSLDAGSTTIPSGYQKVNPPAGPLGG